MFKGVFIIYSSYIKLCKRSIVDGYVEKYMFDCVSIYSESPLYNLRTRQNAQFREVSYLKGYLYRQW